MDELDNIQEQEPAETIDAYERRVEAEGLAEAVEETVEAADADVVAEVAVADAPATVKQPDIAEYLAKQADLQARQTEILERLSKAQELPKAPEPKSLEQQYRDILGDQQLLQEAMNHPKVSMDYTDDKQVAVFRTMVYNAILEEQAKRHADTTTKLEARINAWEQREVQAAKKQSVEAVWKAATANLDTSDADIAGTIRETVDNLVEDGVDPKVAVTAVLKKFGKLLKAKPAGAPANERSPEAKRGIEIAASTSRGANRTQAFKKGQQKNGDMDAFERSFLS